MSLSVGSVLSSVAMVALNAVVFTVVARKVNDHLNKDPAPRRVTGVESAFRKLKR